MCRPFHALSTPLFLTQYQDRKFPTLFFFSELGSARLFFFGTLLIPFLYRYRRFSPLVFLFLSAYLEKLFFHTASALFLSGSTSPPPVGQQPPLCSPHKLSNARLFQRKEKGFLFSPFSVRIKVFAVFHCVDFLPYAFPP